MFLVCPMRHAAVLMTVDGSHKLVPLDDEVSTKCGAVCFFRLVILLLINLLKMLNLLFMVFLFFYKSLLCSYNSYICIPVVLFNM